MVTGRRQQLGVWDALVVGVDQFSVAGHAFNASLYQAQASEKIPLANLNGASDRIGHRLQAGQAIVRYACTAFGEYRLGPIESADFYQRPSKRMTDLEPNGRLQIRTGRNGRQARAGGPHVSTKCSLYPSDTQFSANPRSIVGVDKVKERLNALDFCSALFDVADEPVADSHAGPDQKLRPRSKMSYANSKNLLQDLLRGPDVSAQIRNSIDDCERLNLCLRIVCVPSKLARHGSPPFRLHMVPLQQTDIRIEHEKTWAGKEYADGDAGNCAAQ